MAEGHNELVEAGVGTLAAYLLDVGLRIKGHRYAFVQLNLSYVSELSADCKYASIPEPPLAKVLLTVESKTCRACSPIVFRSLLGCLDELDGCWE